MASVVSDVDRRAASLRRRIARWKKHPPAIPVALDAVDDDLVRLAYRAKDGTLGIAVFKNTYLFTNGGTPEHVQQYIREVTARAPDDLSEGRMRVSSRRAARAQRASGEAPSGRPARSATR